MSLSPSAQEVEIRLKQNGFTKADFFIGESHDMVWVYVTRTSRLMPIKRLLANRLNVLVQWHGKPKPLTRSREVSR